MAKPMTRFAQFARFIAALVTGIALWSCGDSTRPAPLENKVFLPGDIVVTAGDYFSVPVYFENMVPVAAISVPLKYPTDVMRCDSVSFIASRCSTFMFQRYFTEADTIQMGLIDTLGVIEGSGLLATLHFWAFGNAPETDAMIDLFVSPFLSYGYADTSLVFGVISPRFQAGKIHIKSQL
jgi:hypothetical protein